MFDKLIKNGKQIDGSKIEIAISAGKIAKVDTTITDEAKEVIAIKK